MIDLFLARVFKLNNMSYKTSIISNFYILCEDYVAISSYNDLYLKYVNFD